MKNIFVIIAILLTGISASAQKVPTDLQIANDLVKNEIPSVKDALTKMNLTFQIIKSKGRKTSVFIEGSKNNMKRWLIETRRGGTKGMKRVTMVTVDYHMDNGGDFFDLKRYGNPPKKAYLNNRKIKYKKSQGRKLSTLVVTAD